MSPELQARIAEFKAKLPPETGQDFDNLLSDVVSALQAEADQVVADKAKTVPVLGPLAASVVRAGIDKAFEGTQAEVEAWFAAQVQGSK